LGIQETVTSKPEYYNDNALQSLLSQCRGK
jgi:hypothetical protein